MSIGQGEGGEMGWNFPVISHQLYNFPKMNHWNRVPEICENV